MPTYLAPRRLRAFLVFATFFIAARARADLGASPAKFEPPTGCYVGAFIERDFSVKGDIGVFEQLTKKKHASYLTYVGYGHAFPADWVLKVKAADAAPQIAFEPNNGLDEVKDDEYLRDWARDAGRMQCPIFLRWASEMNGPWTAYGKDPAQYRDKFQLVSRIMKEEAPNVAMVWTPFAEPRETIASYYPGDEWVDWVGVNIYCVYVHNGDPTQPAAQEDPTAFLQFIYDNYSGRKPIHISEFAATSFCGGTRQDTVSFAIDKMTRFYTLLRQKYPRVKCINWFCLDTIRSGLANNDYSLTDNGLVLETYRKLVANPYFLGRIVYDPASFAIEPKSGTTLGPDGVVYRRKTGDDEALIDNAGAIAATIKDPWIRGLKDGDVVQSNDDLQMRVQMPVGLQAHWIRWEVDGLAVALTNTEPYRIIIPCERLGDGHHVARVVVYGRDVNGEAHPSPEVKFTIKG